MLFLLCLLHTIVTVFVNNNLSDEDFNNVINDNFPTILHTNTHLQTFCYISFRKNIKVRKFFIFYTYPEHVPKFGYKKLQV